MSGAGPRNGWGHRTRPAGPTDRHPMTHFVVVPDRSAAFIEARSNVGPISFGTTALSGYLDASVHGRRIESHPAPRSEIQVDLTTLRSGNTLYDAELAQRMSVRRYPHVELVLTDLVDVGEQGRYHLRGHITVHGVTRPADGSVTATLDAPDRCIISGEQLFDIRDFDIPTPSILMLRIYPDVRVYLRLELHAADRDTNQTTREGHD